MNENSMTEPTMEPEVIRDMRVDVRQHSESANDEEMWGAFTLGQEREVVAYIESIVAERDAAVREREDVSSQLWDCMSERDGYKARLAACERVVEAAEYFCSYQGTASEGEKYAALNAALDAYSAAVATAQGEG